jgi:hypothetical protein
MEGTSYLIDYGDLLARFCLSFVFLWSGAIRLDSRELTQEKSVWVNVR